MKKHQSWRPKEWRVFTVNKIREHRQIVFHRGPGKCAYVTVKEDDAIVTLSAGIAQLPMPPARKELFIDEALAIIACWTLTGDVPRQVVTL